MLITKQTRLVDLHVEYLRPRYRNVPHWRENPDNVYIGRAGMDSINGRNMPREGSVWANPFKIGRDGEITSRLIKYREHILTVMARGEADLRDLEGKCLGCWCVHRGEGGEVTYDPNLPFEQYVCHGQVLMQLIAEAQTCLPVKPAFVHAPVHTREEKVISTADDFPVISATGVGEGKGIGAWGGGEGTNKSIKPLSFAQILARGSKK
ncbi:DUF4326 domain-containing protein [archaeon]|nr:MAG: DUF4326 domain-containing protein [archaeon]